MPITRSVRRQAVKGEFVPEDSVPVPAPVTAPASLEPRPGPSSKRQSASSKKSVQRAEAFEKLAKARFDEARAATALAEAELSRIEAEDTEGDDQDSAAGDTDIERDGLVRNWLENKTIAPNVQMNTPMQRVQTELKTQGVTPQVIDVSSLTAALTDAARAMHAPRYLVELPNFSGASGEWLAFRAAYRDTHSHFTKAENLARLRRCLKGLAREATMALFVAETDPDDVLALLEMRFGRPDTLVISEMERLRALPRLTDNPRDICIFASKVINIVGVVKALKRDYYLYNPETIRALVDKMTPAIRYRWYDFAAERPEDEADLIKLSAFLSRQADLCSRYAQAEVVRDHSPSPHHQRKSHRTYLIAPSVSAESRPAQSLSTSSDSPQCIVCDNRHAIQDCDQFKALIVSERWEKAKEINACFRCLKKRSFRHRCRYRACGIEECKGSHHHLLHAPRDTPAEPVTVASARQHVSNKALLKIVPVRVKGPSGTVDTFALLDEGSTITLIEEETARAVGATGPIEPFAIEGVAGARVNANTSRRVNFYIGRRHSEKEHMLEARTIDRLHLSCQSVDKTTIEDCEHLLDITDELVYDCGTPTLLIGQDNWHMIVSKSIKSGVRGTPVASLTELGWVLHGPSRNSARVHFVTKLTVREEDKEVEERLEDLLKKFIDIDSLGVEPKRPRNDPDARALTLLEKHSHRLPDGRFETGLLWRSEELELPENKDYAMRRLIGIENKLDKDPYLKHQYNDQITHLLDSGFAEVAPSSSRSGRTWYLPHFAVVNPSKPKPRIVLDAAAKTCGVSLNDMLLTGPDLLQSLPGVLMRFRQRSVAVSGDIKEMFLQISIRSEDRDALRFLWRADKREEDPTEYRMKSVIFGAASSPCTAIYIKNRNAEEYRHEYPDAADAISKNHYMDDYLQSFDSKEDAIRIAKEVSHLHQQAKFHLQKWASYVHEVVDAIEPQQKTRSEEVLLQDNSLPALEKTLGLVSRTNEDTTWELTICRSTVAKSNKIPSPAKNRNEFITLEPHYLKRAETLWWRATQQDNFEDEIVQLERSLPVKRDSRLRTLSVTLDPEGILRLKSRIDSAPHLPEDQRSPPILDGRNTYTRLYIAWIHKQNHHAGPETVINEVRTRLWVIRLRPVTRRILKSCIRCRILRAKPSSPATGDHPSGRLAHHQRPFTFVGLDYFGPYNVTVGRHHEKRYVALFTCLTTRAVHLELAGSLSTDSAIMALRRMMARRGCPSEVHSDNGTNLRGADAELRRAAYQVTKEEAAVRSIRWRFIPPGAPFMGGVWERMVQSIKRALAATLNTRNPSEEVLFTLLLEAEYTVNNRPLTPVSTSPDDFESLTPLHFILGGPARVPQPGSFEDSDLSARQRWRQTQRLADMFWSRWLKEYISILQYRRDPRSRGEPPQLGDLVLIIDENLPRNSWPKGRIVSTYPGKDGVIRVVEVRTKAGNVKRLVKKIVVLACGSAHDALGGECEWEI